MVHHAARAPGLRLSDAEAAAAAIEAGRILFSRESRFVTAAQALDHLPPADGPEIAFAGRSNVGKSSLINALTGRRALARASNTPGRTRQLNFFDVGGRLTVVDMPGYGYAEAPKSIKEDWQALMFAFLRGRPTLRRVFLLLDARVEVKASDGAVMELLDVAAVTYQLVVTKIDGVSAAAAAAKRAAVTGLAKKHAAAYPEVLLTSSETGFGIEALRAEAAAFARPEGRDDD